MYAGIYYGQVGYGQIYITPTTTNELIRPTVIDFLNTIFNLTFPTANNATSLLQVDAHRSNISSTSSDSVINIPKGDVTPLSSISTSTELLEDKNTSIMRTESDNNYVSSN